MFSMYQQNPKCYSNITIKFSIWSRFLVKKMFTYLKNTINQYIYAQNQKRCNKTLDGTILFGSLGQLRFYALLINAHFAFLYRSDSFVMDIDSETHTSTRYRIFLFFLFYNILYLNFLCVRNIDPWRSNNKK